MVKINSNAVNFVLKLAFSKSGVVVRWLVGMFIGWLTAKNVIPSTDLETIRGGLVSGLTALFAVAYAIAQFWLNKRATDGVNTAKEMLNRTGHDIPLDGVIGNHTVNALQDEIGVPVAGAANAVR